LNSSVVVLELLVLSGYYEYKSPCGAEGEEKARYPQGLDLLFYTILFLLSSQPEVISRSDILRSILQICDEDAVLDCRSLG
jgi:hypothetical protein